MNDKLTHVCFVAPSIYPLIAGKGGDFVGGSEAQQLLLAKALIRKGIKVTIVTGEFGQQQKEIVHRIEIIKGSLNFLGGSKRSIAFDMMRLLNTLRAINADVTVVRNPPVLQALLALYRILYKKPVVRMIASDMNCEAPGNDIVSRLIRWSSKFMDYTIFQNNFQQKMAGKNLGLSGCVLKSIAHEEDNESGQVYCKDFDVLWVGAFNHIKQPDIFVDVAKSLPQYRFCLIAKKAFDTDYKSTLRKAESLSNLKYVGFVPFSEVGSYFRRSRVYLNTSAVEGFPNTFLQALNYELPIVSLKVDPDQIIQRFELGTVSGTKEKIINDLNLIFDDKHLYDRYVENGKIYFRHNHDERLIVDALIEILERVMMSCNERPCRSNLV